MIADEITPVTPDKCSSGIVGILARRILPLSSRAEAGEKQLKKGIRRAAENEVKPIVKSDSLIFADKVRYKNKRSYRMKTQASGPNG
jgi:hypothetical protein